jgi:hypothetical protein
VAQLIDYFYSAGAASLAMLILGLPFAVLAVYVTNARRTDSLQTLPASLFGVSLSVLRTTLGLLALHGVTALFLMIAFVVYVSVVRRRYDPEAMGLVVGHPMNSGTLDGGFGLTVTAFVFSLLSGAIVFLKQGEMARFVEADGAGARGSVALNQGFESASSETGPTAVSVGGFDGTYESSQLPQGTYRPGAPQAGAAYGYSGSPSGLGPISGATPNAPSSVQMFSIDDSSNGGHMPGMSDVKL